MACNVFHRMFVPVGSA